MSGGSEIYFPAWLPCSQLGRLGMLILVLLPIVSLLPISNFFLSFFFFPEADAVLSTLSAWPYSPALGSVTHSNKRREAGDRPPHTRIILPPLSGSGSLGHTKGGVSTAAVPIRDTGLMAGAELTGLPGHNAAAAGEQGSLFFCLLQLLVFLQGSPVKFDLAHAVRNVLQQSISC